MNKFIFLLLVLMSPLFSSPKVIILLGAPGAGKGTQAAYLKDTYCLPHISTGDLFRENLSKMTPIGQKAKGYMDKGELVPDSIVVEMLGARLEQDDCKNGYILDGFPRTLPQAELLKEKLDSKKKIIVLSLEVPDDLIVQRLTGRFSCEACGTPFHKTFSPPKTAGVCDKCGGKLVQRKDDIEEVIRNRLMVFHNQTAPLKEYYQKQGLLFSLDGTLPKDVLSRKIDAILNQ